MLSPVFSLFAVLSPALAWSQELPGPLDLPLDLLWRDPAPPVPDPGGLLAWQQQTPPPPDTTKARQRHRETEKLGPPPEGPWGVEDFGLTWLTPVWRGLFVDVEYYSGTSIELNVPVGAAGFSDGVSQSLVEHLEWRSEKFRTTGGRLMFDLDMLRLSLVYYSGSFDAFGRLIVDQTGFPEEVIPTELRGSAYGFRFAAYWPAIRYRDSLVEASIGPTTAVGWLHQEVLSVPVAPFPIRDTIDILTGSFGVETSLRTFIGRFAIEADAEASFVTGAARGWVRSFLFGVGYHF